MRWDESSQRPSGRAHSVPQGELTASLRESSQRPSGKGGKEKERAGEEVKGRKERPVN